MFSLPRTRLAVFLSVFLLWFGFSAPALASSGPPAETDATALVRRALIENRRSIERLRNYIYISDATLDSCGKNNTVTKTETSRREIFLIDGEPVFRTLLVNGQPLAEKEHRKEEKGLDEKIADAQSPAPRHRQEREEKAAGNLAREMAFREDIVEAYTFTLAGEETVDGRRLTRIAAEPKPGFKGKSQLRALLPYLHGTLLIDPVSGQWVRIEASMIRKLGGGPVYLGEESKILLQQSEIAPALWALTRLDVRLNTRLLWEHKNFHLIRIDRDFRRFGSSVSIVGDAASPE